jgi:uncharacterized membrane protein YbhN (UPF0104 family)
MCSEGGRNPAQRGKYTRYLLALVVIFIFLYYLYRHADRYRSIFHLSSSMLVAAVSLVLVTIVLNGLVNYWLYRQLGANVRFGEAVCLAFVNSLANHLPFAAGMVAKGVYLKRRHQLAYSNYFSATLALYPVFLMAAGLMGVLVLVMRQYFHAEPASPFLLLGFIAMLASTAIFWLPFGRISLPAGWNKWFTQILEGWRILRDERSLVLRIIAVYLATMLSTGGRYWIAFHALSQNVTLAECVLFAAVSTLSQLVTITPGGLGVREGIVAAVASVLGFDARISALAVGIDRLVVTSVSIVMGTICVYVLNNKPLHSRDADS